MGNKKNDNINGELENNQTMEDILNNLKNPFNLDGFVKLLNLFVNSRDWGEFYSSVVTKNQDRSMEIIEYTTIDRLNEFMTKEPMSPWWIYEYFSKLFPTEHRVYINSSLDVTPKIVKLFITECEKNNIPFELKYIIEATNRSDEIIIGGNSSVFKKQIDILRNIASKHPEFIKECGTPHMLTSELDGWMGLADENVENRYHSYTQARLGLIMSACRKYLLKHNYKIEGYDKLFEVFEDKKSRAESKIKNRNT